VGQKFIYFHIHNIVTAENPCKGL